MSQDPLLARLLANNAQWALDVEQVEPGFFAKCAEGQSPKVLWIGCADSRVPESVLTACKPGDIFVHRNIANQFHVTDDNAAAVLTYAVEHLGVSHVVVAGHTHCGGAAACHAIAASVPSSAPASSTSTPPSTTSAPAPTTAATPLARWLEPLTTLARELGGDVRTLEEANVRAQVANLATSPIMRAAWEQGRAVAVHGWLYELEHGRVRDLGVSVYAK